MSTNRARSARRFMLTTSVLYEQDGLKSFQIAFLVAMLWVCLYSARVMVSMMDNDSVRPVIFSYVNSFSL